MKVAQAIEKFESSPKEWFNPGAIRNTDGTFKKFATYAEGFSYLCSYLERACTDRHKAYNSSMNVLQFFSIYAPVYDRNSPTNYAKFVANEVGLRSVTDPIKDWLLTELEWSKKYNYTPFLPYPEDSKTIDPTGLFALLLRNFKTLWSVIFRDK